MIIVGHMIMLVKVLCNRDAVPIIATYFLIALVCNKVKLEKVDCYC